MKTLIIANWKCNPPSQKEANGLFSAIEKGVKNIKGVEAVICPPFIQLHIAPSGNIKLGGQNCFWEQKGAYTGEISPLMLRDAGCVYVLVGHSERRNYFGETNEIVNKKLKAVLQARLSPVLCVGETRQERDSGQTESIIKQQLISGLRDISAGLIPKDFSIAYEPVWAIGTGNPCDPDEAQKMGLLIKKIVSEIYNRKISENIRILYGGSVNSKHAAGYIKEAKLQGLLVGGASLLVQEFVGIIEAVK